MKNHPRQSWQNLRNYTEKFAWDDPRTGIRTTGFNPPQNAILAPTLTGYKNPAVHSNV